MASDLVESAGVLEQHQGLLHDRVQVEPQGLGELSGVELFWGVTAAGPGLIVWARALARHTTVAGSFSVPRGSW